MSNVLILNPNQRAGYSGPTVLIHRLVDALPDDIHATVVGPSGNLNLAGGHTDVVLRGPKVSGRMGQIIWSIRSSLLLLQRRRSCHLVHLHGAYLYALLPAFVAGRVGIPYVLFPLSAGGDLAMHGSGSRLSVVRKLRRRVVSGASGGFALAPRIADEMSHWGLAKERIEAIGNPVAPEFFRLGDASRAGRVGGRCILFVGKLGERKGPHLIVKAVAELRQQWPDVRAVFIGPFEDRAYQQKFQELVDVLGVNSKIEVTGHVEHPITRIPGDASVFVLPSNQEGLPGALAEAMAIGLPVGVTAVGAMEELVSESSAGAVICRSGEGVAVFVDRLWSDPGRWARHSEASFRYSVERFSSEEVAKIYLAVVKKALELDSSR